MNNILITIHNIKGIDTGIIELPIENGLYSIVGNNGCGKSTIMSCLAQTLSKRNLSILKPEDYDDTSYVEFNYNGKNDKWYCENGFWKSSIFPHTIAFNGTYEGSLFYGLRFKDSKNVDELMESGKIANEYIVTADKYITEKLGEILHNNPEHYNELKRIRNKNIASHLNLKNTPYFYKSQTGLISQYRMSSGECLLVSLLHFIYNSIIRRSLPADRPILMLIDEIELALHPIAITNLLNLLQALVEKYSNLTIIITSHSPEVIRKIPPKNIYKLERINNKDNNFHIVNPCYPSYAIRDVYTHDGFDYLLLVEDELAKKIIVNSINKLNLNYSRLINVTPVGGWQNVLKLQYELINKNILGVGKTVFSILDGDIQNNVGKEYKSLKKLFLPISSIEKYLLEVLISTPNIKIKKEINDKFFNIDSLDQLLNHYTTTELDIKKVRGNKFKKDSDGKRLYAVLIKNLEKHMITEDMFINGVYEIIKENVDLSNFNELLRQNLS